jgi:pSer/pThr/pTyr-binding forkhead associated (FHA) protein
LCAEYDEPNCVRACPHDAAIRVEPRAFFARDLAGIQLAVTPADAAPLAPAGSANMETRLISNIGELLNMLPQLKIVAGPKTGEVLQLRYPSTSFGRSPGNDYKFPDDSLMSRSQAVIVCEGSGFLLRDLNSTNGTMVNGQPVTEIQLQPGDVIELGEMQMEFLAGGVQ